MSAQGPWKLPDMGLEYLANESLCPKIVTRFRFLDGSSVSSRRMWKVHDIVSRLARTLRLRRRFAVAPAVIGIVVIFSGIIGTWQALPNAAFAESAPAVTRVAVASLPTSLVHIVTETVSTPVSSSSVAAGLTPSFLLTATAATAPAVTQCNPPAFPTGAGFEVTCTITIENSITAQDVTSSTVTATACLAAAGVLPPSGCTTTVTTSTQLVTSVNQCNGIVYGGGSNVTCNLTVINNIPVGTPTSAVTVDQCIGSGTGGGTQPTVVCTPLGSTTDAAVTQCNGSGNGGGAAMRVQCTVSGAVAALPVTITQCNGSANGGGSTVTCTTAVTNNFVTAATTTTTTSPATTTTTTTSPSTTTTSPTTTTTTSPATTTTTTSPTTTTSTTTTTSPVVPPTTVPPSHTGEPWAGWPYWALVGLAGLLGLAFVGRSVRIRRRRA